MELEARAGSGAPPPPRRTPTARLERGQVRVLPIRSLRVTLLSFLVAVACVQMGSGMVVAEAWRARRDGRDLSAAELIDLQHLLERLRVLEGSFAAGAVVMVMFWTFLAVWNVRRAARSTRSPLFHAASWLIAPAIALSMNSIEMTTLLIHLTIALLVAQMFVLYLPFALLGGAAEQVGGTRAPLRRWYLGVVLVYVIHVVFTSEIDLTDANPTGDLGRAALLYLANGCIVGVVALMTADATRSIMHATDEKAYRHNFLEDDALSRFRLHVKQEATGHAKAPTS